MKKRHTVYKGLNASLPTAIPGINVRRVLETQNTPESRFMLRAMDITASRGGLPTTTYEDGQFVFTYPDGTVTRSGRTR